MFCKVKVINPNTSQSNMPSTSKSDTVDTAVIVDNEQKLDVLLNNSQKQKAEIIWALKVVLAM